jgi:hypothetical protein
MRVDNITDGRERTSNPIPHPHAVGLNCGWNIVTHDKYVSCLKVNPLIARPA